MIKRLLIGMASCLSILLVSGCANKVVVSEVLQMQVDDKLYTKTNIWYTNAEEISCLNIQQGEILPIGSEIEIVVCNENKLQFTEVASGKVYTIIFKRGERMETMSEYVSEIITTKNVDKLLAGISDDVVKNIKSGKVEKGMTKAEVELAYGVVPPIHTPDKRNITWMYPIEDTKYVRLIFSGDKLKTILNLYDAESDKK